MAEIPFDSDRKRMTTLHSSPDGAAGMIATKGAVEAVLDISTSIATAAGHRPMSDEDADSLLRQAETYAADGYRVLAMAGRPLPDGHLEDMADAEGNLVFYGLVAMADPPRKESQDAVAACREAGITPIMITGDHPATAQAIATRLGILDGAELMTGAHLAEEHSTGLANHVDQVAVFARTSPEQKIDIVQAWKSRGDIVAMTGDGVNGTGVTSRRHRSGDGHHRHRSRQGSGRHGAYRRQLRHHCRCGARRTPDLRQHPSVRPLHPHLQLRGNLGDDARPVPWFAPRFAPRPHPVDQPRHRRSPRAGPRNRKGGTGSHRDDHPDRPQRASSLTDSGNTSLWLAC